MTLIFCILGLVALIGLGAVCLSIQRTHNAIHSREDLYRGDHLFMSFDIWT